MKEERQGDREIVGIKEGRRYRDKKGRRMGRVGMKWEKDRGVETDTGRKEGECDNLVTLKK